MAIGASCLARQTEEFDLVEYDFKVPAVGTDIAAVLEKILYSAASCAGCPSDRPMRGIGAHCDYRVDSALVVASLEALDLSHSHVPQNHGIDGRLIAQGSRYADDAGIVAVSLSKPGGPHVANFVWKGGAG